MKEQKHEKTKKQPTPNELAKKSAFKKKAGGHVVTYALIVAAGIINTLGLYIFILPNRFSPGGVTGIATMIYYLNSKINTGYMIFLLNVPLLIAAFFVFNRQYVIKTAITITFTSGLLILFERIPGMEKIQYHTDQLILPAIAGGCISGVAMGILFRAGGSNGGSEIIGGFINKKFPQYNTTTAMVAMDIVVVILTAAIAAIAGAGAGTYVVVMNIIIASIIKMFCSSMICTTFLQGLNSSLKFEVVTLHPDELSRDIINELGRGVTKINALGAFTGQKKTVLICIIRSKQISSFQRILKKYPDTFAYMMNTKEVYGRGFSVPGVKPEKLNNASAPAEPDSTRPEAPMNGNE